MFGSGRSSNKLIGLGWGRGQLRKSGANTEQTLFTTSHQATTSCMHAVRMFVACCVPVELAFHTFRGSTYALQIPMCSLQLHL